MKVVELKAKILVPNKGVNSIHIKVNETQTSIVCTKIQRFKKIPQMHFVLCIQWLKFIDKSYKFRNISTEPCQSCSIVFQDNYSIF